MTNRNVSRFLALAFAAAALLALAAPASAGQRGAATKTVVFASCHSSGQFAACEADGTIDNPLALQARIDAAPGQKIEGSWALTCTKGKHSASRRGIFHGRAPQVKTLPLPFPAPNSCVVAATTQLTKSGTIKTDLTATVAS
jgi:hypothetical protein